ncbi:HNH endonuclease family protein [Streptomyces sp. NPDC058595]|uniref:HNH endonuclease family protein n=1 Tax=Streptomyces sp. NPDC058595 TaxID=3346550 RepID=UPI0036646917
MMTHFRRRTPAFVATALLASLTLVGAVPAQADSSLAPASPARAEASARSMPEPVDAAAARALLAELTVADEVTPPGYSRSKFPHWITQSGTCDTREVTLKRDGQDVQQDAQCRAVSGTWYSEYDAATWTVASDLDIDHMVPLKEAWKSGAADWPTSQRREFANDLTLPQIIAVTDNVNQAKGDKDPGKWVPPLASYHCTYGRAWIQVKHHYNLTTDPAEKTALTGMLNTCS